MKHALQIFIFSFVLVLSACVNIEQGPVELPNKSYADTYNVEQYDTTGSGTPVSETQEITFTIQDEKVLANSIEIVTLVSSDNENSELAFLPLTASDIIIRFDAINFTQSDIIPISDNINCYLDNPFDTMSEVFCFKENELVKYEKLAGCYKTNIQTRWQVLGEEFEMYNGCDTIFDYCSGCNYVMHGVKNYDLSCTDFYDENICTSFIEKYG